MSATVTVEMSTEQFVRRWLLENALCAVDEKVMYELTKCYRKFGSGTLVYHPDNNTYSLREKAEAAA